MQKDLIENNPNLKLSFGFSLLVIENCEKLDEKKKFITSKQVLRSGTSIGANSFESQNGESKADFIHKMKIAAKEAVETQYWLMLCEFAKEYPDPKLLLQKLEEITKGLNKILTTAKRKPPFSYLLSYFYF